MRGAGENSPLIILPVSNETMERIRSRIDSLSVSQEQKDKWKASLLQVPARGYTWQQDYMQPFINPQTGQVVLREVQNYGRHGDSFSRIAEATEACGFIQGPMLTNDRFVNGNMGGNIEALPAGICLLGDDNFESETKFTEYANQICSSNPGDRIKVPTSWLKVGHTDEIMKVVRNKNQNAPCDFSVVLASPKKGLELLRKNPQEQFLNFSPRSDSSARDLAVRRSNEYRGLRLLCRKNIEQRSRTRNPENQGPTRPTRGVTKLFDLRNLMIPMAFAGVTVRGPSGGEPEDCSNMTNDEMYRLFTQDEELKDYNELVQTHMDSLRTEIQSKIKNKLPQCNIDFIEAPDLFFGGQIVQGRNGKELPNGMGLSILPNPTNAISVNDTIISPDPSNAAFKKHLEEEYRKRGLNPEFVDTFDYAHQGDGNLHCSTNTIHICRPRGSR